MIRPKPDSPTVYLSSAPYRGREIVVILYPRYMALWLKGTKHAYQLDYLAAYQCAAKLEAALILAEKTQIGDHTRRGLRVQN